MNQNENDPSLNSVLLHQIFKIIIIIITIIITTEYHKNKCVQFKCHPLWW